MRRCFRCRSGVRCGVPQEVPRPALRIDHHSWRKAGRGPKSVTAGDGEIKGATALAPHVVGFM